MRRTGDRSTVVVCVGGPGRGVVTSVGSARGPRGGTQHAPELQTCVDCRRNFAPSYSDTGSYGGRNSGISETSFTENVSQAPTGRHGGNMVHNVPTSLFQGSNVRPPNVPPPAPPARGVCSARTNRLSTSDLCTRTSWVDAETAYNQVKKGKAHGKECALRLRWKLQKQLYSMGCFIQKHCGKVLFLGLLLLSLACVGLKTARIETNVEKLWVKEGGRLESELEYTRKVLGEGSGSTHEIVLQTPQDGSNLLSVDSFLLHYKALRTASKISVELNGNTWKFRDLCFKPSFPEIDEGNFIDRTLEKLQPCVIITPLDCFWEGSKLLGPEHAIHLPGYNGQEFKWTNLNPQDLVKSMSVLTNFENLNVPFTEESIKEILRRAGISTAYQEKPCLDPTDVDCPKTAPNFNSSQPLNIGKTLTGGCSGLATRYMHWEEDIIVGGIRKDREGTIVSAEAIQSLVLLMGEQELFDYYRGYYSSVDWTLEIAKEVLQAWQRKFTKEINKVALTFTTNKTTDNIYPFSSTSLLDMLQDFSQFSTVRVGLGYAFMLVYSCLSMLRWSDPVQSQSGIGIAGVLLVSLSVAAGLGVCSALGIMFNASTTQIIPFLALGLGVDDMFLIAHTVAENAQSHDLPYMEQTGECLKRVGVSVILTSLCNAGAFGMAAVIPIPALRAFCVQAAVLVLFNLVTILVVFPAVISLDMIRREEHKVDVLCCFTGSNHRNWESRLSAAPHSGPSPPPEYYETTPPPAYDIPGLSQHHQTIAHTDNDGTHPVTMLAPPAYEPRANFHCVPTNAVCPVSSSQPPSTTSSQQCLAPEQEPRSCRDHCRQSQKDCCSWPLTRLARNVLAPLLQKTPSKILVVIIFLVGTILGIIGIIRVEDGLDITDVVPRDTVEYKFLKAQSQYFGFYNFHAVTKEFDYASDQQLLLDYYKAFQRVDNIIKKEDGSLPDFWLALLRDWLQDLQMAYNRDRDQGRIVKEGWYSNASDDGVLAYHLMVQTGEIDHPIDKYRAISGHLVDKDGIIYPPAFYNYLSAWVALDTLAYVSSEANIHPVVKLWYYQRPNDHNVFFNASDHDLQVAKSSPIIFSQIAFYLHDLGDTASITKTVQKVRNICDTFAEHGLPNYPSGVIFTFWEQYLSLRFYLMLALILVLGVIFLVLTLILLNPWTAIIVVAVLAMMVVELFGFMGLIGIKLSAVPAVILIVSVGIGVEFTVHISLGFITAIGSRNKRMRMALEHMFAPVMHGAMTTFLGVIMLALSEFDFIVKYFFVVLTALIVLGLVNGLILLPVLLSVIGPAAEVIPADRSDFLAPPTPEPSPLPSRRDLPIRSVSRRVYPRMPSDISLTTITEEPSSQYSSHDSSQIAVHVQPEVIVETSVTGVDGTSQHCSSSDSPSSNTSTPPLINRQVTTVKATTRVKVEVHAPYPGMVENVESYTEYKSKKRKAAVVKEVEPETDSDSSQSS